MGENDITFNDKKISKSNFCRTKRLFKIDDIDVNKIISEKELNGKKTRLNTLLFHDYIGPLCTKLPQMIEYVKCFGSNKTMSFKIVDYNLLKDIQIWEKVDSFMYTEFNSEPV